MSYHQISWNLEHAKPGFKAVWLLRNFIGIPCYATETPVKFQSDLEIEILQDLVVTCLTG